MKQSKESLPSSWKLLQYKFVTNYCCHLQIITTSKLYKMIAKSPSKYTMYHYKFPYWGSIISHKSFADKKWICKMSGYFLRHNKRLRFDIETSKKSRRNKSCQLFTKNKIIGLNPYSYKR